MFVHNVFFYLKDGTPDPTRDAIAQEARTQLAQIPGANYEQARHSLFLHARVLLEEHVYPGIQQ